LGGGRVLDPFPPARNRRTPARIAALRAMRETNPGIALMVALEESLNGVDLTRFSQSRNIRQEEAQALWQNLAMQVIATPSAAVGFAPSRWTALQQAILDRLATEHQQAPDSLGPDRARLHRMTMPALARPVFSALLDTLLSDGRVAQSGPWLHLPEHKVALTPAEEKLWQRILPILQNSPFQPPRVRDIAHDLAVAEAAVRMLLRQVARAGEVYLVAHDHYFTKDAVEKLSAIVRNQAEAHDCVRAAEFRDQIGVGRKLAIQILEFFDRIGYTRRTGDEHRLRQEDLMP
jgi:selenocysteine-specific elongation factor